ncbi:hypothetical protein MPTK1_2g24720 [Marchantia polymorpha subsp. ruderalis]|uniref:Uncharacterized protein n=2 Tax=Marchantia polymorpha TaxID=3197 RepID=A0A176VGB6_MARPO|nr:hypothetical protein AXG93_4805s1040 [Marchantia polymorpha subsp. ruderalis]PTQ27303.1 hypothetical protein MARPO_0207s0010 [Marchantia polymorpha]PTQ27304.1 hypothetical protein MARPO_0207s0010 [Marchantia polymorpha]BBN03588.1 hypothetical protein Mp_2g24720 [Marchantia polymorpha subsp. ruderalis]BBN03589.1 hypothetical protein Mp_2g24720 [Marchantia polymorpha subsp. ruderalis]|eukprot:PTQ27303.1 hypothetical protein MARPO_0207s0010 [Marchantia polymorpha]
MEEEKAAAYYDELVRKGGNAAKYKQGLGFGTSQSSLPKSEAYGSLSNFVKSSPGRTAALEKEVRLDGIRDKLKKRDDDHSSRKRSPDRDRTRDDDHVEDADRSRSRRRRKTPELRVEDRKREKHSHRSSEGTERDRKRRSRSRSRRRSVTPEKILVSKKRELQQRSSRSPSHGSSGTSSERTKKRSRRSKRDRSKSPREDSRSKQRRSPERSSRSSPSRLKSKERRTRDRSRSRSRGRDADRSYRRDGSYSPQRSRRGRRSRSPTSHRSSHRNRDSRYGERISDRSDSHRTDSSRGRYDDEKRHRSARDRTGRAEENPRFVEEKNQQRDYSKLIANFESMTPAEKVKAKMKLQLSETVVKDKAKGMSDEWERFDFNKDAPLDDDAKQDYFGDGTGSKDDTVFLKNTGSTFLSSSNQVTREAQVQSAHDNAIFGPPQGLRIRVSHPEIHPVVEGDDHDDESDEQPIIVTEAKVSLKVESPKSSSIACTLPVSSVVSQQVIAMQQAGSWQERARKMREARGALEL